jgi:hypothetical protein
MMKRYTTFRLTPEKAKSGGAIIAKSIDAA